MNNINSRQTLKTQEKHSPERRGHQISLLKRCDGNYFLGKFLFFAVNKINI